MHVKRTGSDSDALFDHTRAKDCSQAHRILHGKREPPDASTNSNGAACSHAGVHNWRSKVKLHPINRCLTTGSNKLAVRPPLSSLSLVASGCLSIDDDIDEYTYIPRVMYSIVGGTPAYCRCRRSCGRLGSIPIWSDRPPPSVQLGGGRFAVRNVSPTRMVRLFLGAHAPGTRSM